MRCTADFEDRRRKIACCYRDCLVVLPAPASFSFAPLAAALRCKRDDTGYHGTQRKSAAAAGSVELARQRCKPHTGAWSHIGAGAFRSTPHLVGSGACRLSHGGLPPRGNPAQGKRPPPPKPAVAGSDAGSRHESAGLRRRPTISRPLHAAPAVRTPGSADRGWRHAHAAGRRRRKRCNFPPPRRLQMLHGSIAL